MTPKNTCLSKLLLIKLLPVLFIVACGGGDASPPSQPSPPAIATGQLNTGFGNSNGFTSITGSLPKGNRANAVLVDKQDRILVAGQHSDQGTDFAAIWRFTADGTLDTNFAGGTGYAANKLDDSSYATSMAIDNNGQIVVAGYSNAFSLGLDMVIWRYTVDGELDPGFGSGKGYVSFDNAVGVAEGIPVNDAGLSVVIDTEGRLLVAGYSQPSTQFTELAVWRLMPDGSLDKTFGNNGVFIYSVFNQGNIAMKLALTADNKVIVGGINRDRLSYYGLIILKLDSAGQLDTTFNDNGILIHHNVNIMVLNDPGNFDLKIDSQERILIAANTKKYSLTEYHFTLWRYTSTGIPDISFGDSTGMLQIENPPVMSTGQVIAIEIDGQNNILVTVEQYSTQFYNANLSIWRFIENGVLDSRFGINGVVSHNTNPQSSIINQDRGAAMCLTTDGKILIAGYSSVFSQPTSLTLWQFK